MVIFLSKKKVILLVENGNIFVKKKAIFLVENGNISGWIFFLVFYIFFSYIFSHYILVVIFSRPSNASPAIVTCMLYDSIGFLSPSTDLK